MHKPLIWIVATVITVLFTQVIAQSQTEHLFTARVMSVKPFIVEFLNPPGTVISSIDARTISITEISKVSSDEIEGFQFGDIITGRSCTRMLSQCDGGNLHNVVGVISEKDYGGKRLINELRDLKKLDRTAKERYKNEGLLFLYTPDYSKESALPRLLINRDGSVLLKNGYGDEIKNKQLSKSELNNLIKEYESTSLDKNSPDLSVNQFGSGLVTAISKYQTINVGKPPINAQRFLQQLEALINNYLQKAIYHISYLGRSQIKDWEYGDILPLDQAANLNGSFWSLNGERLSKLRPPPAFFKEANYQYGTSKSIVYRYENEIYNFQFGQCTTYPTGTWGCSQTWKLVRAKVRDYQNITYDQWSNNSQLRLNQIPKEGLDIPATEFFRHREFYTSLFGGSNVLYQEGNYLYGLNVTYH